MIFGIRVQDLRSIADSGLIKFRKINVLVGRNSAGKSTLLRVFPLLRQSVEQRTKSPILWYGRLVDFGTFRNAVRAGSESQTITFTFHTALRARDVNKSSAIPQFSLGRRNRRWTSTFAVKVRLTLGVTSDDSAGGIRELEIIFPDDTVLFRFHNDSVVKELRINGQPVKLSSDQDWFVQQGKIIPTVSVTKRQKSTDEDGEVHSYLIMDSQPFAPRLRDAMLELMHGRTKETRVEAVVKEIAYVSKSEFYKQLIELGDLPRSYYENLENEGIDGPRVSLVRTSVLLNAIESTLGAIDTEISRFASSVRYIEPLRATAERYYRLQDLAIDEIDSRGTNVAMFLNSLRPYELSELQEWMQKSLGFYVQVHRSSGHVEVEVVIGESGTNIADLGFGFSQLLPIVLQMWKAMVQPKYRVPDRSRPIVAVEQPELHLHPQYQALLADVVAAVFTESEEEEGIFFAETHSEHFLNRLGELVASKKLNVDDVQVLVVEQGIDKVTTIKAVEFSAAGFLGPGWPSGFFVPGVS